MYLPCLGYLPNIAVKYLPLRGKVGVHECRRGERREHSPHSLPALSSSSCQVCPVLLSLSSRPSSNKLLSTKLSELEFAEVFVLFWYLPS